MATKESNPKIDAKRKLADEQKLTLKSLEPQAHEINERLERAAKASGQAVDHRVSAALVLGKVKAMLQSAKLDFAEWCDKNVKKFGGYENCRKLAAAGASGDAKKVALAIADMRERNAKVQRKSRAARKVATRHTNGSTAPIAPKMTPFKAADAALKELGDGGVELVRGYAGKHGMEMVDREDYKKLKSAAATIVDGGLKAIKAMFSSLTTTDQIVFVEWAGNQLGFEVKNPLKADAPTDGDTPPIPAFLNRADPEVAAAAAGSGGATTRRVRRK